MFYLLVIGEVLIVTLLIFCIPGAKFHDFHHYNFLGNYASTFLWWDWLFGTDQQYKEFCQKQEELKNKTD